MVTSQLRAFRLLLYVFLLSTVVLGTRHRHRAQETDSTGTGSDGNPSQKICEVKPRVKDNPGMAMVHEGADAVISVGIGVLSTIDAVNDALPPGWDVASDIALHMLTGSLLGGTDTNDEDIGNIHATLTCMNDVLRQLQIDLKELKERVEKLEGAVCEYSFADRDGYWHNVELYLEHINRALEPDNTDSPYNTCGMTDDKTWKEGCDTEKFAEIIPDLDHLLKEAMKIMIQLNLDFENCDIQCNAQVHSSIWLTHEEYNCDMSKLDSMCRRQFGSYPWCREEEACTCRAPIDTQTFSSCQNKWYENWFERFYMPAANLVEAVKDAWVVVVVTARAHPDVDFDRLFEHSDTHFNYLDAIITQFRTFHRKALDSSIWKSADGSGSTCSRCNSGSTTCNERCNCPDDIMEDVLPGNVIGFQLSHYEPSSGACLGKRYGGDGPSRSSKTGYCKKPLKIAKDLVDNNIQDMISALLYLKHDGPTCSKPADTTGYEIPEKFVCYPDGGDACDVAQITCAYGYKGTPVVQCTSGDFVLSGCIRNVCTPYSTEACRAAAQRLGLQEGGGGYDFEGDYTQKGCYAYSSGQYTNMVYYGSGGSHSEISSPETNSDQTYRPEGYDCVGNTEQMSMAQNVLAEISSTSDIAVMGFAFIGLASIFRFGYKRIATKEYKQIEPQV